MQTGIFYAALSYLIWGLIPLYFKSVQSVPSLEILMHRMVWSLLFLLLVLLARRQWRWLGEALRQPRLIAGFVASAIALGLNWFFYIWAVNNGHIVDASLGYFINPLLNVLLGYVFFKERLRVMQWGAVALAATGVIWLTWQAGQLPWIGLVLAASFGTYGVLRKTAALGALEGLTLETMLLCPIAIFYLGWLTYTGHNAFVSAPTHIQWLLAAAGPITAVPLLLFAAGARRIPMSLLGLLQYIGPTVSLMLGVWVYGEAFPPARLIGYAAIWAALGVYTAEGLLRSRKQAP